jgi:hypothetical protein
MDVADDIHSRPFIKFGKANLFSTSALMSRNNIFITVISLTVSSKRKILLDPAYAHPPSSMRPIENVT